MRLLDGAKLAIILGGARLYTQKVFSTRNSALVAYWPLTDAAGTSTVTDIKNSFAGTVGADMTFGAAGPSTSAKTAVTRSGTNTTGGIALYSTALRDVFPSAELTMAAWIKVSGAGVWADATNRAIFSFRADASNQVAILKTSTANTLRGSYTAGGTASNVNYATAAPVDWLHVCMTVSKAADEVKFYVNGSQVGSTVTGLGTWSGLIATGVCWIGGYSSLGYWSGVLGHAALWNAPLTASEVATLAVPFDGSYYRTMMAIGDSKTANNPNWPDYVTSTVNPLIVHRPARFATGGWTTQVVKDGIDAALAARSDTPDMVCINLGANDVNTGDPGATWRTNTEYIVDAIHTKWPNARVYLTKVWRRNTGLQAVGIAAINGYTDTIVAARSSWLSVAVNEANIIEGGDDGVTYTSDGVHPNEAGCTLLAAAWRAAIL